MLRRLLLLGLIATAFHAAADAPKHQVHTQFDGVNVAYQVDVNTVRTTVFITNRGAVSARCTVHAIDNYQKKTRAPELEVHPTQTQAFMVNYSISVSRLQLFLLCKETDTPADYLALYEQQQRDFRQSKQAEQDKAIPKLPQNPYKLPN